MCKTCQFACVGKTFSSTSIPNLPSFEIGSHINYNSKWIVIVYIIACKECQVQYMGCTLNPLKIRIRRHVFKVTNMSAINILTANKHFVETHHRDTSNFVFMGIEKVVMDHRGGDIKRLLLKREAKWMFTLGTRC